MCHQVCWRKTLAGPPDRGDNSNRNKSRDRIPFPCYTLCSSGLSFRRARRWKRTKTKRLSIYWLVEFSVLLYLPHILTLWGSLAPVQSSAAARKEYLKLFDNGVRCLLSTHLLETCNFFVSICEMQIFLICNTTSPTTTTTTATTASL